MLRHVFIASLLVFLTACGSSPKTEFYVLSAEHGSMVQAANANSGPAIGVWSVKLPGYLERSEIVTRESEYEIRLGDFSWWAGNLDDNMTQLIANQLSQSLQSNRVVVSPWASFRKIDYQALVRVERFDGALGGEAVLRGVWSLLDADGQKELRREAFEFKASAAGTSTLAASSYADLVAALSRLTVQLAEQIANGIREQMSM
jgi:uncharacterized lipoprotein YmbA